MDRRIIFLVAGTFLLSLGSLSYAVTVPANVIAYVPITLTNYQSTAVSANTPLSFVFNALAYQQYETNTLNNTELFYQNGTIGPSWLEGNYLNEQQQANTLYTSGTVMYWLKSPQNNIYLPANTGTATTNTIYLGFKSNLAWNLTANVGVAPQLTCANPANTVGCAPGNGVYGGYGADDTGNVVFNPIGGQGFYDNFKGNIISSTWNTLTIAGTSTNTIANGIYLIATPGNYIGYNSVKTFNALNVIVDGYTSQSTSTNANSGSCAVFLFITVGKTSCTGNLQGLSATITGFGPEYIASSGYLFAYNVGNGDGASLFVSMTSNSLLSIYGTSSSYYAKQNYGTPTPQSTDFNIIALTSAKLLLMSTSGSSSDTNNPSQYVQFIRVRLAPPNNIMPSASFSNVNVIVAAPNSVNDYFPITLTNNQATASNTGTAFIYNYNALAYNTLSDTNLQNVMFFYANQTPVSAWLEGNSLNELQNTKLDSSANIVYWLKIQPSLGANGGSITIYMGFNALNNNLLNTTANGEAPQLSSTYAQYDDGNVVFPYYQRWGGLAALPSGWASIAGVAATTTFNPANTIISQTLPVGFGGLYQTPASSYLYNPGNAVDWLMNTYSTQSDWGITSSITLSLLTGAYSILSNANGGINYYGATTGNAMSPSLNNQLYVWSTQVQNSANSIISYSYANMTPKPVLTGSGATTYYALATGTGIADNNAYAIYWERARILPPNDVMPSISNGILSTAGTLALTLSNTLMDNGQSTLITATSSGFSGTPYTYNYIISNSTTDAFISSQQYTSVSSTSNTYLFTPSSANIYDIDVVVTNAAKSVVFAEYPTIKVNSTPSATIPAFAPATINTSQTSVISTTLSGGTGPFTANFVYANGIVANTISGIAFGGTASYTAKFGSGGTYTYNVIVTDTGTTTPYIFNTVQNTITVTKIPLISNAWTTSNKIIDIGQYQTLNSLITGNAIITNSIYLYNAIGALVLSPSTQPDVLVQHSNGILVGYNSTSNTNASRGTALLAALTNIITGDSIYLRAETYNTGSNPLYLNGTSGLVNNIKLYGAGKYATIIQSSAAQQSSLSPGINDIVADLSIYNLFDRHILSFTSPNYGNDTFRNVYWQGYVDNLFLESITVHGNTIVENSTLTSGFDTINIGFSGTPVNINIFDSTLNPIINNSGGQDSSLLGRGANVYSGNLLLVNTIINVNGGGNAGANGYGVQNQGGNVMIYGGSITLTGMTGNSLNGVAAPILINATTSYNALNAGGTISNTLGVYGAYTYQKYPMTPPGNWLAVTTYQENSIWGTGTFTANIITINATSTVSNSIQYTVYNVLTSSSFTATNPITIGQTQTVTSIITGGAPPYIYSIQTSYQGGGICVSNIINAITSTDAYSYLQPASCNAGAFISNLIVTDSASTQESASNSLTYTAIAATNGAGGGGGPGTTITSTTSTILGTIITYTTIGSQQVNSNSTTLQLFCPPQLDFTQASGYIYGSYQCTINYDGYEMPIIAVVAIIIGIVWFAKAHKKKQKTHKKRSKYE